MSRVAPSTCPLSDCTLAVDNAENINNSKGAALLGLKAATAAAAVVPSTPRGRALLRSVKAISRSAAAGRVTPCVRSEVFPVAKCNASPTPAKAVEDADAATPLPYRLVDCGSSLDSHVFAKPFTPALTVHRNDPYSLCLVKSVCTPEDSFYACYGEAVEAPVAMVNPASTPIRTHTVCQATALPAETQALLDILSKATTSSFQCASPNAKSMKASDSVEQSPVPSVTAGGLTTTPSLTSTPERILSFFSHQVPATPARVIRKVVSCGVDRTSGRPVPKPKK
ncbi:hypothetical protein JKF63_01841 [Porcisia hertigi]|uniref:Uncharacterized protein n=1 Tax=Porcisia hertigi TaxID=2761500 RepID=A0A836IGI4_9TRYP|nr:hypothetical protein JKF63_01841 [Porcisia hertigi]